MDATSFNPPYYKIEMALNYLWRIYIIYGVYVIFLGINGSEEMSVFCTPVVPNVA